MHTNATNGREGEMNGGNEMDGMFAGCLLDPTNQQPTSAVTANAVNGGRILGKVFGPHLGMRHAIVQIRDEHITFTVRINAPFLRRREICVAWNVLLLLSKPCGTIAAIGIDHFRGLAGAQHRHVRIAHKRMRGWICKKGGRDGRHCCGKMVGLEEEEEVRKGTGEDGGEDTQIELNK